MDKFDDYPIAFTQTVNFTLNKSYKGQYDEALEVLVREIGDSCDMLIWPELTLNGRIHFHGVIKVIDKARYFRSIARLKYKLGHNLFKLIDNVEKWKDYVQKDVGTMERILRATPADQLKRTIPHVHLTDQSLQFGAPTGNPHDETSSCRSKEWIGDEFTKEPTQPLENITFAVSKV